jgi:hypothetical protein
VEIMEESLFQSWVMQRNRVTPAVAFYKALFCNVLRAYAKLLVVPPFVLKLRTDGQGSTLAVLGNTA